MRRRRLLAALPALATAGCLGVDLPFGNGSDATELRDLVVRNIHDRPHVVHLQVEHDGDLVHQESYEVRGMRTVTEDGSTFDVAGGTDVPCAWPTDAGRIVLRGRVDDRKKWKRLDLGESDADCLYAKAQVEQDGRLVFLTSARCGEPPGNRTLCGTNDTTE
ncbi:hypothetical protein [Halomicrococcus gelatinilyticus]|uniref:hypothetical protein n=1 Tax=Halomicrococcus gelatinilyticus TaxID=1702103 RepID=UPI002E0E841C